MSAKKGGRSAIGVGIATLVTIMVAVLLTTFSVLTLVTASADLRLSYKTVESTTNYYAADSAAELWLGDLDAFLAESENPTELDLSSAGYTVSTNDEGRVVVSQEFPIDTTRVLVLEVAVEPGGTLDILKWQSTSRQIVID
jgi:hypothetical protein